MEIFLKDKISGVRAIHSFRLDTKSMAHKWKFDKLNLVRVKYFCHKKEGEWAAPEAENVSANHATNRRRTPATHRVLNSGENPTSRLERAEDMNRHFTEVEAHTEMRTWKDAQHDWSLRKGQLKPQEAVATGWSELLRKGDARWAVAGKPDHSLPAVGLQRLSLAGQSGRFGHSRQTMATHPPCVPGTWPEKWNLCPHRPLHGCSQQLYN